MNKTPKQQGQWARLTALALTMSLSVGVAVETMPKAAASSSLQSGQPVQSAASNDSGGLLSRFKKAPKFLPVNEAFQVATTQSGQTLKVHFTITPKHYVYRDKLHLKLPDGVSMDGWRFDIEPVMVDDPQFGKVAVFMQNVTATTTLVAASADTNLANLPNTAASLRWQGCAVAGLCYPPEIVDINLDNQQAGTAAPSATNTPTNVQSVAESSQLTDGRYTLNHHLDGMISDPFGLGERPILAIALLFLAGIALAFTACVYPMIPIVANIIARDANAHKDEAIKHHHAPTSAKRGLLLTGAYGMGVATSYGLLGALVAYVGQQIGLIGWLQNPWLLGAFALLFAGLALQMLGLVHVKLPQAIRHKLAQASQMADHKLGSVAGSYLVGLLSALVVSPCVSAPLGGALIAVSVLGDVALGFMALFALGAGLSLPLIMVGAVQGKFMPSAGQWMDRVKEFGGFMLLAVALLLVNRVFLTPAMLIVWALLFVAFGVWAWRLTTMPMKAVAVGASVWAVLLLAGAQAGAVDAWQPVSYLTTSSHKLKDETHNEIRTTTLNATDKVLIDTPKVLVYVTADWCIECRVMERTLFAKRPAALADWQIVKLDITDTSADSRAILARYGLFGAPAFLYYKEGQLVDRQIGEVPRSTFEHALSAVN